MPQKKGKRVKKVPTAIAPPTAASEPQASPDKKRLDYYSGYNAEHRSVLLERKRTRYANDAVYREKVIKAATARYHKLKGDNPARTTEHTRVCPMCQRPLPRASKVLMMRVDGSSVGINKKFEIRMYSIGELSIRLLRQVRTIKAWIQDGIIPESRYRNSNQRRLWTIDQIEMLDEIATKYDLPNLHPPISYKDIGFVDDVKREWQKLMPLGIDISRYKVNNGGYYCREEEEEKGTAA